MTKEMIHRTILEVLKTLAVDATFSVERPEDSSHGDYASNVALVVAKSLKRSPRDIADMFVSEMAKRLPYGVEKVEVAGAGFINFFLKREYFVDTVADILKSGKRFGQSAEFEGKRVMVEYTDPNPFKEFHIGHLMSNTIGESIARLFEAQGAEVKRACYQGDVGLHVAKAMWGMRSVPFRKESPLQNLGLEASAKYLGHAYSLGVSAYESGRKEEIEELNRKIYDRSDAAVNNLYDWGKKVSLEYFERIYERLGTKFDFYFFESDAAEDGRKIVEQGLQKGVFEKSDGAVVFRAEKHNPKLHTRVFVNSQNLPTYEAKELGLTEMKQRKWNYDTSVVVTGNEVNDYFRVLLAAMKFVLPELAEKTKHISHGMLRLPTGKMASRTGEVITAESLITQVGDLVEEKVKERDYDEKLRQEIRETVSIGAIKYSILRQAIGGDIIFDFEKSISFEGDSGPYLQYSAARANSVLLKAKTKEIKLNTKNVSGTAYPFERILIHFPEVVSRAGKENAPHLIVTYLTELAGAFNSFYAQEQIVDKNNANSPYKLALTVAFRTVLENGLWILGIKAPSRM